MTNLALVACAIILVESGGDDSAVGPTGDHGAYQITEGYLIDAGTGYSLDEMHQRPKAAATFVAYMERYCTREWLGVEPTVEHVARLHHRGCVQWADEKGAAYWTKVREKMEEQRWNIH